MGERDAPENISIEFLQYHYGTNKQISLTILLGSDVNTERTNPNFALYKKYRRGFPVNNFLFTMPFLKIFFFHAASVTKPALKLS